MGRVKGFVLAIDGQIIRSAQVFKLGEEEKCAGRLPRERIKLLSKLWKACARSTIDKLTTIINPITAHSHMKLLSKPWKACARSMSVARSNSEFWPLAK